jgi:subtilisin family serine protease
LRSSKRCSGWQIAWWGVPTDAASKEDMVRKAIVWIVLMLLAIALVPVAAAKPADAQGDEQEFVVVYAADVSLEAAHAAITAAGGTIVKENASVGVATITTRNANFMAAARRQSALMGVAHNKRIGQAPQLVQPKLDDAALSAQATSKGSPSRSHGRQLNAEPLAYLQWDMAMIHATVDGSYKVQRGDKRVLVGILDTGVDGSHPDIAPNFSRRLSRNFTTDIPLVDGACATDPDGSCEDPADVDEHGHGTHVAGTIGAALNGLGIAGIAPNVTIVNLRAGQDSGYFFLQASVDALTYAGDIGVDVVNMSYYIDPWLFNCANNPADSPEAQLEQRTIIEATNRALKYAHKHGVTLIASAGNEHTDLGNPTADATSPDFPPGAAYARTINNSCLVLPTEGKYVISVTAIGPSKAKADYSNYGVEQAAVSAPGGYFRDNFGTPQYRVNENLILSAYPKNVGLAAGKIDPVTGDSLDPAVIRDCKGSVCAYYQYLQGTSMASPHAVGVAALIVSEYGKKDRDHRDGLTLDPDKTEKILYRTATDQACPEPRLFSYANVGRPAEFDAFCEGNKKFNGFYGNGIVDALNAVKD